MNKVDYTRFEEKDNEEIAELLRLMAQVSNHGSEEYKTLELRASEWIDKLGGVNILLQKLDEINSLIK